MLFPHLAGVGLFTNTIKYIVQFLQLVTSFLMILPDFFKHKLSSCNYSEWAIDSVTGKAPSVSSPFRENRSSPV